MHPDERTLAAAIKRTLAVEHGAKGRADTDNGWSYHEGNLETLLGRLLQPTASSGGASPLFVQLHEAGEITLKELLESSGPHGELDAPSAAHPGAVVVLGDQLGYTAEEDALLDRMGSRRVRCSSRGLLTSHCIVLAHDALDEHSRAVEPRA